MGEGFQSLFGGVSDPSLVYLLFQGKYSAAQVSKRFAVNQ
jgi:hypothetical protein